MVYGRRRPVHMGKSVLASAAIRNVYATQIQATISPVGETNYGKEMQEL